MKCHMQNSHSCTQAWVMTCALQELAIRSSFHGIAFWRGLFLDSVGSDVWQNVATVCLAQVHGVCLCVAQYVAAVNQAPKCAFSASMQSLFMRSVDMIMLYKSHAAAIAHCNNCCAQARGRRRSSYKLCRQQAKGPEWNRGAQRERKAARPRPVLKEQKLVEDYALRHGDAAVHSAHVLADVACLARQHDECGMLQMPAEGVPGLADVAHVMMYGYALLDTFLMVRGPRCLRTTLSLCAPPS
jgi:hypothetical protein